MVTRNTEAETPQGKPEAAATTTAPTTGNAPADGKPEGEIKGKGETTQSAARQAPEAQLKELTQRYKTLEGLHKQATEKLKTLESERGSYESIVGSITTISQRLDAIDASHGERLDLLTDLVGGGLLAEDPDAQARLNQSKQKRAAEKAKTVKFDEIASEMAKTVTEAEKSYGQPLNLPPQDAALKPAWDAARKGNAGEALRQLNLVIIGRIKDGKVAKTDGETTPAPGAEPQKAEEAKPKKPVVPTGAPRQAEDWRDLSPKDKLKRAVADQHNEQ